MRKVKGKRKKKIRGRIWNCENAVNNCSNALFAQVEHKVNGKYFGKNINIFKTLGMIY